MRGPINAPTAADRVLRANSTEQTGLCQEKNKYEVCQCLCLPLVGHVATRCKYWDGDRMMCVKVWRICLAKKFDTRCKQFFCWSYPWKVFVLSSHLWHYTLGCLPLSSPTRSTWIPCFRVFAFHALVLGSGSRLLVSSFNSHSSLPWPVWNCSRTLAYRDWWTFGAFRWYPILTTSLQVAHRGFQDTSVINAKISIMRRIALEGSSSLVELSKLALLGDAVLRILRHHLHYSSRQFRLLVLGKTCVRQ